MLILPLTSLHSGILECRRVTGDGCFLMKLAVIDLANLEPVLEPFWRWDKRPRRSFNRRRSHRDRPVAARATSGLGQVLVELVRLSNDGRLERIKTCDSDECRWVFYDRSKPSNRRWCSSERCGNREKTRTYRKRHAGASA